MYEIESHLYLVLANAATSPIHTSSPSMGCALVGCPNFKRRMFLKASSGVAVGSLYTLTMGWIKGKEYTNSHRMPINPIVRIEARKRSSILFVWRPAVFQEKWTINGIQITPAEKTALVCEHTRAMNDMDNKHIAHAAGGSNLDFDIPIDTSFER